MRRGRILTGAAIVVTSLSFAGVGGAYAATPQDICKDLKDGVVNGSYTAAEWTAFFSDPTIQGYGCGGTIVPPHTTPPVTPPTTTPPATPVTVTPAVPLVPVVVSAVKGASHTGSAVTPVQTAAVKGAQHTAKTPTRSAAAPITTAKKAGTLPFTGAQLALFLLVGLGLVATGLVLRATGRRRPEA